MSVVCADITISGKLFHIAYLQFLVQRKIFLNHSDILIFTNFRLWPLVILSCCFSRNNFTLVVKILYTSIISPLTSGGSTGGGGGTMALPKLVKNFVCTNFLHTSSVSKCSCITAVTCNAASVYCSLQSLRECCVRTYSTAHFPTTYMQSRCSRMFSISPALFVPCPATIAHVVPRIFLQRRWNPIDGVSARCTVGPIVR